MPLSIVVSGCTLHLTGFLSFYKADAILKELRPLVENKDDISVGIMKTFLTCGRKASVILSCFVAPFNFAMLL